MERGAETAGSICLDASELHHLAPLLGFVGDELAEVGAREREHVATQVGKARLDLGIGKASVDLLVEFVAISAGVFLGAPKPNEPVTCLLGMASRAVAKCECRSRLLREFACDA